MSDQTTIRDVLIRIAVKMGAIELPTLDFSKWGAGLAADLTRAVQSQMNQVNVSAPGASTKSYDPAYQQRTPPTSTKSYDAHVKTFEQAQREAQAGTNKAYAQEEIKRQREQQSREKRLTSDFSRTTGTMKKDEEARYAGTAKAYGQDEVKKQKEQSVEAAGIAKAYSQDEIRRQQEEAERLKGIAKAYAQDELNAIREANEEKKRLGQEAAETRRQQEALYRGTAKAYEQDETKKQREQAAREKQLIADFGRTTGGMKKEETARYAGVAKSYAQDEEKKIRLQEEAAKVAEDSQRRQIEAAGQMRMSFGQATDGLFQMARGWALNKAAAEGNLEASVRGFANFQAVIDKTRGAMAVVSGLQDAYKSVKVAIDASAAAAKVQQAVTAAGGTASMAGQITGVGTAATGTASRLGMLTAAMNPFTVATAIASAGVIGYAHHLNEVERSLMTFDRSITTVGQKERLYQKQRQGDIKSKGTSGAGGFVHGALTYGAGVLDNLTSVFGLIKATDFNLKGRVEQRGLHKVNASPEQQAENKKESDANERNRQIRIASERRLIMDEAGAENQVRKTFALNSWNAQQMRFGTMNTQEAALGTTASMKDRALREGMSGEESSIRLSSFGARTASEIARQESSTKTRINQNELQDTDWQIAQKRAQLKPGSGVDFSDDEGPIRRTKIEKEISDLQEKRIGIVQREGMQLRENLKTQNEQYAAISDAKRANEQRLKGMDQRLGEMNEVDRSQFKMLSDKMKDEGGLEKFSKQQLEQFGQLGGTEAQVKIDNENARRGAEYRKQNSDLFEPVAGPRTGAGSVQEKLEQDQNNVQFGGLPAGIGQDVFAEGRNRIVTANEELAKGVKDLQETLDTLLNTIKSVANTAAQAKEHARKNAAEATKDAPGIRG